ncbi:non-muscle cofilin 1-like [Chelmon rostratus]|uniref:non-muscle cofilin 1-like n=1 Tax=Chelmon rostratus TaxID=109905 RepID=UPI001BE59B3C|nr:non-muscle cofilin 1-like [Chelmon rostratus]
MTSGAQLDDEVKDIFQEVKVVKNDDDHMERARLVVFGFKNDTIVVETIYRGSDLKDKDVFLSFKELLEPTKCHYILYDCHFKTTDSAKAELVFVLWCPDTGPVKQKMNFASSKDAFKNVLSGVKHNLQMNDPSDCSDRENFAKQLAKNITELEGVSLKK